jgi:outer membrane immunogenic protein
MKKFLLAAAAVTASFAVPAQAADLARPAPVYAPPPPVVAIFSWTGCYVGGNGGGLWSSTDLTDNTGFFGSTGADFGSQTANGGLGGVQVGCNYQTGNWVFGIQGDYDWASATSNNNNNNTFIVLSPALGISALSASTKIDSLASVTGRVGYSWARFLGYVKGGGAWVKNEYSLQGTLITPFNGTQTIGSLTNTRGGWTVGVGGEYAFLDWLTGFAEYDYYGFTSQSANFNCVSGTVVCTIPGTTAAVGTIPINATQHINVFKVGLNLKFGGGIFGGW